MEEDDVLRFRNWLLWPYFVFIAWLCPYRMLILTALIAYAWYGIACTWYIYRKSVAFVVTTVVLTFLICMSPPWSSGCWLPDVQATILVVELGVGSQIGRLITPKRNMAYMEKSDEYT